MKIAIFGKIFTDESSIYVKKVFDILRKNNVDIIIHEAFEGFLTTKNIISEYDKLYSSFEDLDADMLFCIGGDGTLLESVTHVRNKNIPILGINTGRLGFLATTQKQQIEIDLNNLLKGNYTIDKRSLIWLDSDKDIFGGINFGMNEFTILKRDTSSMIVVHTFIDDVFLNSYWADGLIVSTPTGSTGYSTSCGGPVMLPSAKNFLICPVSGHNLNVRPLIVPDDCTISFEIEGRSKNFLVSLDSRSRTVDATAKLSVKKAPFEAQLIKIEGYNFLDTLRNKLHWGLDQRN